jgi:hypothetical protein
MKQFALLLSEMSIAARQRQDFLKNYRGAAAAAAGFLKFIAAAFFSRTLKKCMNLIEF